MAVQFRAARMILEKPQRSPVKTQQQSAVHTNNNNAPSWNAATKTASGEPGMICNGSVSRLYATAPLTGEAARMLRAGLTCAMRRLRRFGIAHATACSALALFAVIAGTGTAAAEADAEATRIQIPSSASRDVMLSAVLHRPAGSDPMPAVVLMHGCDGWSPAVLRALNDYAEFFIDNGFVVLNLDSFGSRGYANGVLCSSDRQLARALRYRTHDAFDALDYLRAQPFVDPENIFLIGQSNGGSVAMLVAARQRDVSFRGAVALYPWCGAIHSRRPRLAIPLLILGGERDDWVPPQECQRMETNGAELRVKVYENAAHSFDVPVPVQRYLGKRIGFNRIVAEDSRNEMTDFFGDHIQRPAAPSPDLPEHMPATFEAGLERVMWTPPPGEDWAGTICGTGDSCSASSAAGNDGMAARPTGVQDR